MFFAPAVSFIAAVLYAVYRNQTSPTFWKRSVILLITQYSALCTILLLLRGFMAGSDGHIPFLAVFPVSLLLNIVIVPGKQHKTEKLYLFFRRIMIASLALLVSEILICNGKSVTDQELSKTFLPEDFHFSGDAEMEDGNLVIRGDTVLIMEDVPEYARCLILPLQQEVGENNMPFRITLEMTDDNFSKRDVVVQEKRQIGKTHDCHLSFQPYGKAHCLTIRITEMHQPVTLRWIRAANRLPFKFHLVRFYLAFLIAALVTAIITFSWYKLRYNRRKLSNVICIGITIALCMAICVPFIRPDGKPYDYDGTPSVNDPFAMVFDALQHGRVWLDIEPDPGLEELTNMYDASERNGSGVSYEWDYAYHNGKYYCYFGITPIVAYYFPYYWIHHQIPAQSMALNFYAILGVLFLCLTMLTAIRRFKAHPNQVLLILCFPAVTLCCGATYMMDLAGRYQLAMAAGLCFLSLSLFTGMQACQCRKPVPRLIMLFISGASLILCAGARPTMAVNAAVLLPMFFGILADKRQKLGYCIGQAAVFLVPLFAGAAGLMWYNQARFGSPLDFGTTYQFTVSDPHANKLSLTHIVPAFVHYFLNPASLRTTFPFFEPQWFKTNNYQHFVYLEGTIGWLLYPMIMLGMLRLYPVLKGDKGISRFCMTRLQRRSFLLICVIVSLILAWTDFSAGGVNQRYLYDIAPLLLVCSAVTILTYHEKPEKNRYRYFLTCMALVATTILGALLMLEIPDGNLMRHCPELYNAVEEMVVFWQ